MGMEVDDLVRLQGELEVKASVELPPQELLAAVRIALGTREAWSCVKSRVRNIRK